MGNKADLWDELKADLEREAIGKTKRYQLEPAADGLARSNYTYHDTDDSRKAQQILDRMLQMEILSTHVRPATPATFARVAADMRGDEFPEPGMEGV